MKEDIMAVQKEVQELKQESLASELLRDAKKTNKRMFIIWIITFLTLVGVTCYTIYLLDDIGTIQTTQEVNEVDTINGNVVNNGDVYGKN